MKQEFRYAGIYESKKKQNIQEIVEYILSKKYGETLFHDDLSKRLGYVISNEEEKKKYSSTMSRVKNFLIQYGYVLKGISGIGYYILKPSQISKHCFRVYIKSASKLYNKSAYVLDKTDKTDLDNNRTEEMQNMIILNKQLIENAAKTIEESAYYSRKEYYDSLEE